MTWLARIALALVALLIMAEESSVQATPGAGFAVAMMLLIAIPFVGRRVT